MKRIDAVDVQAVKRVLEVKEAIEQGKQVMVLDFYYDGMEAWIDTFKELGVKSFIYGVETSATIENLVRLMEAGFKVVGGVQVVRDQMPDVTEEKLQRYIETFGEDFVNEQRYNIDKGLELAM